MTKTSIHNTCSCRSRRRGFTMTEILVVIALIVLIIALAVPAFSFITGSRSVDGAENLVSAMVSRARAEAIRSHRIAGVAFFQDQSTERSAMSIVVPAPDRNAQSSEPAGLEQYKAWKEKDEQGNSINYQPGDVVIDFVKDADLTGSFSDKKMTQVFVCGEAHTASAAANRPPKSPFWGTIDATAIDTLVGVEYQFLPAGIGAQTINDPDPRNQGFKLDRYLRSGLILFDGDGNLLHRQYTILAPANTDTDQTHLFRLMGFDKRAGALATKNVGTDANHPLFSQLGVVLYDKEEFKTNGGNENDPTNDDTAMTPAEQSEEGWLDNNALSLMVNRYNGTLVRGE